MTDNVYQLRPDDLSTVTEQCLAQLHRQSKRGRVTGIAFVAYVEGHGFIANGAGDALRHKTLTKGMLFDLIDKLGRISGAPT